MKGRNESKTIMEQHRHRIPLDKPAVYQIQIQGIISQHWLGYFDEMEISVDGEDGSAITTLVGQIVDQAALQGMLQKIYTLSLVLVKVERMGNEASWPNREAVDLNLFKPSKRRPK